MNQDAEDNEYVGTCRSFEPWHSALLFGPCWYCGYNMHFFGHPSSSCLRCGERYDCHPLLKKLKLDLKRIHE